MPLTSFSVTFVDWVGEIQRLAPDGIPIVLVGTKSDLVKKRMVDAKEVQAAADKFHLQYIETSSKTGEGVDQVFTALAAEVLKAEYSSNILLVNIRRVKKKTDGIPADHTVDPSKPAPQGGYCAC